jgi:hypothetical protein
MLIHGYNVSLVPYYSRYLLHIYLEVSLSLRLMACMKMEGCMRICMACIRIRVMHLM